MRLRPGDTFDRYTIEQLLGEGGMGEVYRALDTRLHRRVALKVLRKAPEADLDGWADASARMLREARTAASLNHPNAVAIYDVGEHDGAPFLAMELVEGAPLRRFVGADLPQSARLRWLLDIARALAAAHRVGVVHRDIKPENVMLRGDGVIKVLDFGIARRVRRAPEGAAAAEIVTSTVTSPGRLVGTPAYMAPEQLRGEDLDGRADQFSWGVVAYELLSGRLPFGHGRDVIGVVAGVLGDLPPALEGVPEPIAAAVDRALSKRREDRFASMDELIDVLEPFITGELGAPSSRRSDRLVLRELPPGSTPTTDAQAPTTTAPVAPGPASRREAVTPTGSPESIASPRRRLRWPVAAAAALISLVAAATFAARWEPEPPPAPPATSAAPPAPAPTPVTELPPPQTSSPQALASYREGLQGFRDSQWRVAHEAFQRAVELDPFFAAGYLRLAQTTRYFGVPAESRAHFQRAVSLRAALNARDQALLEAHEPIILRDPIDREEAAARASEASRRYPGDAELLQVHAGLVAESAPEQSLELATRCTRIDPEYADCWQTQALALKQLGRLREVFDALDRCMEASPAATDCLSDRALLNEHEGHCDDFEHDTRRGLAHSPAELGRHIDLATALHALGRPMAAVRAALEQGFQQSGDSSKALRALYDAHIRVLTGDLRGAARSAREARQLAEGGPASDAATLLLVQIQQELGDESEAARTADQLLGQRKARVPVSFPIWSDPTVELLAAKLRGGLLDRGQYLERRDAWLRSWEAHLPAAQRGAAWLMGYAGPASTPEEAAEALAALPRYEPLPRSRRLSQLEESLGAVYLLAGRPAEALPLLRTVAGTCSALKIPLAHTLANYQLGLAREAQGDSAGACAAYRVVLERWPPSSGSVTAKAAAARAKELRCPE